MKVHIKNSTNKARSKRAKNDLKEFAKDVAFFLGIDKEIDTVNLHYTKEFNGCYPKGSPLGGFNKLFNNGVVSIEFAKHFDASQDSRKSFIIHELTHVKQLLRKELIVNPKGTSLKWFGQKFEKWKEFRLKTMNSLTHKKSIDYIQSHFPWEREVELNQEMLGYPE